jgi:hypothetical protein
LALSVLIVWLVFFRKKEESPVKRQIVGYQPIDDAGTLQPGKLLSSVKLDADTLYFQDPEKQDENGDPLTGEASYAGKVPGVFRESKGPAWIVVAGEVVKGFFLPTEGKVPGSFRDEEGTLTEFWIVTDKGGDLEVVSFSIIAHGTPTRHDTLMAPPQQIGRFFAGWGWMKGGVESLVQSKAGLAIIFFSFVFGAFFTLGLERLHG